MRRAVQGALVPRSRLRFSPRRSLSCTPPCVVSPVGSERFFHHILICKIGQKKIMADLSFLCAVPPLDCNLRSSSYPMLFTFWTLSWKHWHFKSLQVYNHHHYHPWRKIEMARPFISIPK